MNIVVDRHYEGCRHKLKAMCEFKCSQSMSLDGITTSKQRNMDPTESFSATLTYGVFMVCENAVIV